MRILHWYQNFLEGGGVANAVLALVNAQSGLGHEVLLVAMKTDQPPLYESPIERARCQVLAWHPRIRLRFSGLDLAVPQRKLREQLRDWQPDVLHIHGEFLPSNVWAGRAVGCKAVLTPHGAFHPQLLSSGTLKRRSLRALYVRMARIFFYRRLRAWHAVTPIEEAQIKKVMPGASVYSLPEAAPEQTKTLHRMVSEESRIKARNSLRLLFVGRLDVDCKGLDILLAAFAQATQRLSHCHLTLVLAGGDWKGGLAALKNLAGHLGISDRVVFTGPQSKEAVSRLLADADLFVLLSRHEGCSLSLTEALIRGIPAIVGSAVGNLGYPEIASLPSVYSVNPNISETAEAIVRCAESIESLRRAARDCARRAEQFMDPARVASLHLQRYAEMVENLAPADRSAEKLLNQAL